jgi:RNA polymerase sigma-70 factor (ECF subfamily)
VPSAAGGFEAFYRREWHAVTALAWSLTGSWPVAEELAQEAMADAYRRWDHVGGLDRPGAWVRRAVANRATSHHRRRGVEHRGLARWSARSEADHRPDTTGDGAIEGVGDPVFWSALRSLPERQAQCLALHYLEDRAVADVADVLGCRAATVKVHLHRGRRALAALLGDPTGGALAEVAGREPAPAPSPHPTGRTDDSPKEGLR